MLLAEFDSPEELVRAVKALRAQGHPDVETYTPFGIEELEALEPRPRLPWIVAFAGFLGAAFAYWLQWYLAARNYPVNVGGRPAHSPLAFVPITFEIGILCAGLATVIGLIRGCGLPRLWRPIFEARGFERASVDAFFVATRDEARSALWALGAKSVVAFSLMLLIAGCDLQRMTQQKRPGPFREAAGFADGSAMQTPPRGTVPRGSVLDPKIAHGIGEDGPVAEIPIPVTPELLARGRERFEIVCATCHGVLGDADTPVADRMKLRRPRSLLDAGVRGKKPGNVYQIIENGFGLMPSFAGPLTVEDRWAVVAYVKALQLSQDASLDALPEDVRHEALGRLR